MSDGTSSTELREKAMKCRRLADGVNDPYSVTALRSMAQDYEQRAAALEGRAVAGAHCGSISFSAFDPS